MLFGDLAGPGLSFAEATLGVAGLGRQERNRLSRAVARDLAQRALRQHSGASGALRRGPDGAPIWPKGLTGSISHCPSHAVAVVADRASLAGIGIDVEDGWLSWSTRHSVLTPTEQAAVLAYARQGRLDQAIRAFFVAKEAFFKAWWSATQIPLELTDVCLDLALGSPHVYVRSVAGRCLSEYTLDGVGTQVSCGRLQGAIFRLTRAGERMGHARCG